MRATYTRTERVRHLLAAYELGQDKLCRTHSRPRRAGLGLDFADEGRGRVVETLPLNPPVACVLTTSRTVAISKMGEGLADLGCGAPRLVARKI